MSAQPTGSRRRVGPRARTAIAVAVALVGTASASAVPALASSTLTTGFSGDDALITDSAPTRARWLDRATAEGAQMVRVNVVWSQVAPRRRPSGFNPADPASRGYNWTSTDAAVRDISAHGLTVLLTLLLAPTWAEGKHRPANALAGTWEPSAPQFASFAQAAARRYSGTYPDPRVPGGFLPRVRFWQAWNEPNLSTYFEPQWRRTASGYAPESPNLYRPMLNAFYAAVKGVASSNFVLMAGTAPYGDPPGGGRMRPLAFDRFLFCLNQRLGRVACPQSVHLDGIDHHPYEFYAPTHSAYYSDDIAVPNVWKLGRAVRAAVGAGTVLPRGPKSVWVTEIAWDSTPPVSNPTAVPLATQARYVEQAMYLLWRQGVGTVLWLEIRDLPRMSPFQTFNQSGMFYYGGAPKPAATAFRFPFVAQRLNTHSVQLWGRAPAAGLLQISRRLPSGRWLVVKRLQVQTFEVFLTKLSLTGPAVLRATVGNSTSLPWTQGG